MDCKNLPAGNRNTVVKKSGLGEGNMELKNRIFFFALLLVFLMSISSADALIYYIRTQCAADTCLVGENASWQITLENDGDSKIEITSFELIDYYTTKSLASYIYTGLPTSIYNDAPGGIKINPFKNESIVIYGVLPKPYEYRKLIFFPCFSIAIRQGDIYHQPKDIRDLRYCSKVNESIFLVDCLQSSDCGEAEVCDGNNCAEFGCADCEYAANHTCIQYACCSSDSCNYTEYCSENKCEPLLCSETEAPANHSCEQLQCRQDQYLVNNTCIDLVCLDDEEGINHECQKLNCMYDEIQVPHRCVKLDCNEMQGFVNHTCVDLQCNEMQEYFNHTCRDLDCYFWQDISGRRCINNNSKIGFYSLEASIILLIAAILILDIFKLRSKIQGL